MPRHQRRRGDRVTEIELFRSPNLIVRQVGTRFELIAGERRWRAAQELGLATVPAIVRTANDLEVLELNYLVGARGNDLPTGPNLTLLENVSGAD